jgi:hypothetical protein
LPCEGFCSPELARLIKCQLREYYMQQASSDQHHLASEARLALLWAMRPIDKEQEEERTNPSPLEKLLQHEEAGSALGL